MLLTGSIHVKQIQILFLKNKPGLPQTQGIQGNSRNFQVEENLREFRFFLNSGKIREFLIFSKNVREVFRF